MLLALCLRGWSVILEILLIEDSEAQAYLVRKALGHWRTPYHLQIASSAEEALEILNRQNGHAAARRPHITLLDLNLPKNPSFTVLQAIKGDPSLRNIAVIVLTSSNNPTDIQRSIELHANAYLQKPTDYDAIVRQIEALENFWRLDARFA